MLRIVGQPAEKSVAGAVDLDAAPDPVRRGWLGVQIKDITKEIADSLNLKDTDGALVTGVSPDSPAGNAGMKVGDAVLSVDGTIVKDSLLLGLKISFSPPGKIVKIGLWRDGASKDIEVVVGERPSKQ